MVAAGAAEYGGYGPDRAAVGRETAYPLPLAARAAAAISRNGLSVSNVPSLGIRSRLSDRLLLLF